MSDIYADLTRNLLDKDNKSYDDKRIYAPGFNCYTKNGADCVLIMGLNPASGKNDEEWKNDIDWENNSEIYFHLYCSMNANDELEKAIKSKEGYKKYYYPTYFRPIYNMVRGVYNDTDKEVFWDWLNDKDLKNKLLTKQVEISNIDSAKHPKNELFIHSADLFYYHKTKSTELEKIYNNKRKNKKSFYSNIKKMFDTHLDELVQSGENIKFVYINNGKASKLLYDALNLADDEKYVIGSDYMKSHIEYEYSSKKIFIFFGGMLSSGVTDTFSKIRLIDEIKRTIVK